MLYICNPQHPNWVWSYSCICSCLQMVWIEHVRIYEVLCKTVIMKRQKLLTTFGAICICCRGEKWKCYCMSEMMVRMTGHDGEDDRHMDIGEVCRDGTVWRAVQRMWEKKTSCPQRMQARCVHANDPVLYILYLLYSIRI